jgi:Protein of unknown function (DUF1592)/Protein of unknown function (DUF1588)/Protein of unknown function (DUF1587)/Protein of unknown function (DUF1585)/Protein of unknown function (DUF1595)/Planctomycete cytochrome C
VRRLLTIFLTIGLPPLLRAEASLRDFSEKVRPLLETYCVKCHGREQTKGDVNLLQFDSLAQVLREPKLWKTVADQLGGGEMPPEGKPQPTADERQLLTDWMRMLNHTLDSGALGPDPGRVSPRRLNRAEYNATIQDLFGVTFRPADDFPADGSGGGGFDNNAASLFLPPVLMEKYVAAAGRVLDAVWADTKSKRRALFLEPAEGLPAESAAHAVLTYHALRCFRRPAEPGEMDAWLALFRRGSTRGGAYDAGIKLALRGMLVSPRFLFRLEGDQPADKPHPVTDYELATRLSYFLWASCPDDELLRCAREGTLRRHEDLVRQVDRLLADPRSERFSRSFSSQWLGFDKLLTTVHPDRDRFPEFKWSLRYAMIDEAVRFFHSVIEEKASFLRLIDADYTFLNDELARHYGLPAVHGKELQRVSVTDPNRGGVLGLGAVLTATSLPLRTSPVLRGKWVLDELLGTPPPPPPANAGTLPPDDRNKRGLTIRQQLEAHRQAANCAGCHAKLDPPGFGLENFDPIGRWRTEQAGQPIDSRGKLASGEAFSTPAELKKIVSAKKDLVARNFVERLLSYALGRGIEYYDLPTINALTQKALANDLDSHAMIISIVESYPFQNRRQEPVFKLE